jgi:hypothetical protein
MPYQTTNSLAHTNTLRSIPLLRPVSVLGEAFNAQRAPVSREMRMLQQALEMARFALDGCTQAYDAARATIGELNRRGRKDRHDRAITSDATIRRRKGAAFGVMNRARGELIRARKTLVAAEAALLAVAV